MYRGFGPTLASEYLGKQHRHRGEPGDVAAVDGQSQAVASRKQRMEKVHQWRPRRSRFGELVQWDTSDHDWLEGRGESIYLINMIDDATSQWFARFVASDSTTENMRLLESVPQDSLAARWRFIPTKRGCFRRRLRPNDRSSRRETGRREMPPTQIERALRELDILWIPAHSPAGQRARGTPIFDGAGPPSERTCVWPGSCTLEQANPYLENRISALVECRPWP